MRIVTWFALSCAVSYGAYALESNASAVQQSASQAARQETPDEVIVRGRRLAEFRQDVQDKREQAYAIFNEINSDDDFDVRCYDERKYHSRAKRHVCRAHFEDRITAEAGAEYMRALKFFCPPSAGGAANIQDCIFSGIGQQAAQAARRVELGIPNKRDEMNDEILRLANENDEFAQAILDFYAADQRYDEARSRPREERTARERRKD